MCKREDERSGWRHALALTRPVLLLSPTDFLTEAAQRLEDVGIQAAVTRRHTARIYDWLMAGLALQGISDAAALGFDREHGGITFSQVNQALTDGPSCPRLRGGFWGFVGCGYRKGVGTCSEPRHIRRCPLPRYRLRKGALNIQAFSLGLFFRDVCGGDFVGWIDTRLEAADPGCHKPDRIRYMREALLGPLSEIAGTGRKTWSMVLSELLLAGDPNRERWVAAGGAMIAVDSLVHNLFQRTGILRRFGAEHPYGDRCYAANGCLRVIEGLAEQIDARQINPAFPSVFPRLIQFALWSFCAAGERSICNGNRIDDRLGCAQLFCPADPVCDRLPAKS